MSLCFLCVFEFKAVIAEKSKCINQSERQFQKCELDRGPSVLASLEAHCVCTVEDPGTDEGEYTKVPLVVVDHSDVDTDLCNQKESRVWHGNAKFRNLLLVICVSACILVILIVSLIYVFLQYKNEENISFTTSKFSSSSPQNTDVVEHGELQHASEVKNKPSLIPRPKEGPHSKTKNWERVFKDLGCESAIRLVDIDGDGGQDIIFGAATSVDLKTIRKGNLIKYCESIGQPYPCIGIIYALNGKDGRTLWEAKVRSEALLLNCVDFDVNKDGMKDCIVTGRQAMVEAINVKNGEHLWTGKRDNFVKTWNIYQAMPLPDFNKDGVNEVLIVHGGDPNFEANEKNRHPARLIMLNGATGEMMGRYFEFPGHKESYQSPVVYTAPDGSQYILLGSGGETVQGDFMMLSVPDFYRYCMRLTSEDTVPSVTGSYSQWPTLRRNPKTGIIVLYSGQKKGVMVPPLITDVNYDGYDDIVMSAYEGQIVLYDGKTMNKLWTAKFPYCESYSTPAPGYFNEDDTLDFMVHWSTGAWPFYNASQKVIINGKDGSVMWSMNMKNYEMSSDLTLQTREKHRDIFVYKTKGRGAHYYRDINGEVHGVGVQRVINKRGIVLGNAQRIPSKKLSNGMHKLPSNTREPISHESSGLSLFKKYHYSCDDDIDIKSEAFMMDRTLIDTPIKIMEAKVKRRHYHPVNSTTNKIDKSKDFCTVMVPQDVTTASIGDLDGDGLFDYVTLLTYDGVSVNSGFSYNEMFYEFTIVKVSLDPLFSDKSKRTKVNVTTSLPKETKEKDICELKLLPISEQQWLTYFGVNQNGHFKNRPKNKTHGDRIVRLP